MQPRKNLGAQAAPQVLVQLGEKHIGGEDGLVHARTLECFLLNGERSRTESNIVKRCGPITVWTSRSLRRGIGWRSRGYGKRQVSILWIIYELTARRGGRRRRILPGGLVPAWVRARCGPGGVWKA